MRVAMSRYTTLQEQLVVEMGNLLLYGGWTTHEQMEPTC